MTVDKGIRRKLGPVKVTVTTRYNGWANYETWNVALYMGNDEKSYRLAQQVARSGCARPFSVYRESYGPRTPDGVSLFDPKLNWKELNEAIRDTIK